MAEEEYGLQINKPITLPCDAVSMEYAVSLVLRHPAKDLETTLSMSTAKSAHCISSSYYQQETTQKKDYNLNWAAVAKKIEHN